MAVSTPISRTPFTGRGQELALVLDRLATATIGRGGVLVVSGKAGIGKSRLVAETKARSTPQAVKLLPELAGRLPGLTFAPLRDAEQERRQIFQALPECLLALNGARPSLVVTERGSASRCPNCGSRARCGTPSSVGLRASANLPARCG